MAVAQRISGFVEDFADLLCRREIVLPLLLVLVVSYFAYTPVFGWALTAAFMLAILWTLNWALQRFLPSSAS